MRILASELPPERSYRLITGLVVPRPIAWVTTLNDDGQVNLAPFSAFTFVSPKPPLMGISVGRKGSIHKDTAHNILRREEYVIHIADTSLVQAIHESSRELPAHVSEVTELELQTCASEEVKVPRLTAPPVAMECKLRHCIEFGETRSRFLVGEVLVFHVRDDLLQNGKVDTKGLDPIARIAGPNYAGLGEIVSMRSLFQTPKS